MALKLNIRPEIEKEMDRLLPKARVRSKTEYINQAISDYNVKLKRQFEMDQLKKYYSLYQSESRKTLKEFSSIRHGID